MSLRTDLPRVTVIIPCHNHKKYLYRCIRSVLYQDYEGKISICFVDDASSDGSIEHLCSMFNLSDTAAVQKIGDVDFYLIRFKTNVGPSKARNMAIKVLRKYTDIFSMLDCDDMYMPNKISRCVDVLMKYKDYVGLVYHDVIIKDELFKSRLYECREPYSRYRLFQECIVGNTPTIDARFLDRAGLYDESMRTAEDWDLYLRLSKFCMFYHIAEPLSMYRVTGKNASDVVNKSVWEKNWSLIKQRMVSGYYD